MGIREDNRARMFQAIQETALNLVEEKGLDVTTVADIAAHTGISERTFFRYYTTKMDALMPGQQRLVGALVECVGTTTDVTGVTSELLAVCRETLALEVEQRDFRRISRLLVREPELLQEVRRQEQRLVEALGDALLANSTLQHLGAQVIAEVVTAAWRVAWESFARDDVAGRDPDLLALFDQTVLELRGVLPRL